MLIDHRQDEQIFKQNQENLDLLSKLDNIQFLSVDNVSIEKYSGFVYDLKIENVKNYQTEFGIVHNGGRRVGSACVYLETWHPDIMEFLELRDNTGDKERRAHNLNLANWIPDLFMKRVITDKDWSLIDPNVAPELPDLFGAAFEKRYEELETQGKVVRTEPARKIYARMLRTIAETGNGWMCWKDKSNLACNSATNGRVVHSSNLCVEIIEPTGTDHTAVCNLGSINIAYYIKDGKLDKQKLKKNVQLAVKFLDRVIDRNFYPIPEAEKSNNNLRPVGLGLMGLQDLFYQLKIPFESQEAIDLSAEISEEIYYWALKTSNDLAKESGSYPDFKHSHTAKGILHFDHYNIEPKNNKRFVELREEIKTHGLRNSLLIAIAPTACQVGTNKIRTASGVKSIYDILRDNHIDFQSLESNGKQMWVNLKPFMVPTQDGYQEVNKIWYNGKQKTYKITYEDGSFYEYTGNHTLLVNRYGNKLWIRVDELQKDDDIVVID